MGLLLFLLSLVGVQALAQGFDGQRHTPPAGAAGGLAVERGTIPAAGSVAVFASFAWSPVVFERNGEIEARPLQRLGVIDVMGSIGVVDRLELGLSVPVAPLYRGDAFSRPTYSFTAGPGIGDLRIVPKLAVLGHTGEDGVRLGLAVPVRLPTGDETALRGAGEAAIEPTLLLGGRVGRLEVHGSGGFRLRPGRDEADLVGQEVTYGLGVVVEAVRGADDRGLDLLLEGFGSVDVDRIGPALTDLPLEVLGGLAWRPARGWTVSAGAGPGLTGGLGTPDARAVLGVRFAPGPRRYRPTPDDSDGDRIDNDDDRCPEAPEDRDGFEDRDGCPDPDNDEDGIPDDEDECPNQAGRQDGCPDGGEVRRRGNRIEFDGKIQFRTGSAEVLPVSGELLDHIATLAKNHAYEIAGLRVAGHTDLQGDPRQNFELSEQRAASVVAQLRERGVEVPIGSLGYGTLAPLCTEATAACNRQNRRVEMVIVPEGETLLPADAPEAPPAAEVFEGESVEGATAAE
ncbi:MAG: OmpA family protein [Myxococcota bacterium]